jgi:hypothetical protein
MTPAELKNQIQSVLPTQLGKYTYSNGFTTPAIAVGQVPNEIEVTGIEIIIPNFPTIPESLQAGDTFIHRQERWVIEIVNHGSDKANFYTVIDRLMRYFPRSRGVNVPQSNPLNSLPRYQLTIIYSDGYRLINY